MALLGLISDVHATAAPLQEALAIFKRAGVDQVLCAGDIAGYHDEVEQTVALLVDNDVQTVRGNHDRVCCGIDSAEYFNRYARPRSVKRRPTSWRC